MNAVLMLVVMAAAGFAAIVVYDPRAARWLASVIYSRALAVEAGREAYSVARRSGLDLGRRITGLKILGQQRAE